MQYPYGQPVTHAAGVPYQHHTIGQKIGHAVDHLTGDAQHMSHPVMQPVSHPVMQPMVQPVVQPMYQPGCQPTGFGHGHHDHGHHGHHDHHHHC